MMEKMSSRRRQWSFWLGILLPAMLLSESAVVTNQEVQENPTRKLASSSPLKLTIQQQVVTMDNGLVRVSLSNPGGMVTQIKYKNIPNLLDVTQKESQRGYWDIVWSKSLLDDGIYYLVEGKSFKVIAQQKDKIELSFKLTYSPSSGNATLPLNVDKRFVMLSGQSGFYTYAIYERLPGWLATDIAQTRIAFKLDQQLFRYMAVSDNKQRIMPSAQDRVRGQSLAYPEAVAVDASKNNFTGQVDDKYQYSMNNEDSQVHGWVSPTQRVGFWVITPSYEFKTGGPYKRELTSHVGPTSLATFHTRHYAGVSLKGLNFENGEPWKKVYGPVFIYLNSGAKNAQPLSLWNDAKKQSDKEIKKWPHNFVMSPDFVPANQRATVSGNLLVNDRLLQNGKFLANSAYVGLAAPGNPGSWQWASKGYQFWTKTDGMGSFNIRNVRPGTYSLYAWIPGIFGDYKYETNIVVLSGNVINLGVLVFNPPRNGPTIWEIGIPDRSAAEFYVPHPSPKFVNPLFLDKPTDRYRQYGLWDRYTNLYPNQDLNFKIGVSDYRKDWFFAHVTRRTSNGTYVPATWRISFDLKYVNSSATYTLRLALASASLADVQVRINDLSRNFPDFSTTRIGTDNAIPRHGIHGMYWPFSFDILGNRLVNGSNSIFLTQRIGGSPFNGVMYDYLRLEGPTT